MKYIVQAGSLYQIDNGRPGTKLACIKSPYYPVQKTILSPDGRVKLYADIQASGSSGKIRERCYTLKDPLNQVILRGTPGSASHITINTPRIDHVKIDTKHKAYVLTMKSSQECRLVDEDNWKVAEILHNGTEGGWKIEAEPLFTPYVLMGLYIFCRYLDKENEFITV